MIGSLFQAILRKTNKLDPRGRRSVEYFNDALPTGETEHLGPASVVNDNDLSWYKKGAYAPSLETTEEVFLRENFDARDEFDSSLEIQNQIELEMKNPVVEMFVLNNESTDELQPEIQAEKKQATDKNVKIALGLAVAYMLLKK